MKKAVRLPGPTHRLTIVGRTGSGKTQAAAWHLSNANFDEQPWVILNFKGDALIDAIEGAREIGYNEIPDHPGIYILRPLPGEEELLGDYFVRARMHENVGFWVDEGYMTKGVAGFDGLLTQGRSKHIPMIILSQRPVWLSRFVFSEADFYQIFHLNSERDRKIIEDFVPDGVTSRLKEYHSLYYDVGKDKLTKFKPVPPAAQILSRINERLEAMAPRRRYI